MRISGAGLSLWALVRHGIVGAFPVYAVPNVLASLPITLDAAAWFFPAALVGVLWVLALLGYGFRTALAPSRA